MSYSRWENEVQLYLKHFSVPQHGTVIVGLLSGGAFDIVADTKLLEKMVTQETFVSHRHLLDRPGLPAELRREYHAKYQWPAESIGAYIRDLRRMTETAFAEEWHAERDKHTLEQLLEGVQTHSIKKEFHVRPPECLDTAIQMAAQLDQVEEAMRTQTCWCGALRGTISSKVYRSESEQSNLPSAGDKASDRLLSVISGGNAISHQGRGITDHHAATDLSKVSVTVQHPISYTLLSAHRLQCQQKLRWVTYVVQVSAFRQSW
ncbi:unnamed protein product [Dicrocoelium dendriticum]|nr:unnamed protein product [Dicrocoelium dendriticum]